MMPARRIETASRDTTPTPRTPTPRRSWWHRLDSADREFARALGGMILGALVVLTVATLVLRFSEPRVVTVPGPTITVTASPEPAAVIASPTASPTSTPRRP